MPKKTILVIDDEKDLLKLLYYNLSREGYEVLLAETGEKGFELARSKKPDLVILDLMLPQMDGFEVSRLLKTSESTKAVPILILTAKNSETDHVVGLEMGAADYLTKPFSVKVLLARLKNLLKTTSERTPEEAVFSAGALRLNRERFLFTMKGRPVALTKKEFEILAYFMAHPEVMISRERLVNAIWGEGAIVSSASLNMHMKSLRDKLGKWRGAVETVRGSGFRFLTKSS